MTLNPGNDLKVLLPMVDKAVEQAMQALDAVDADTVKAAGKARDALTSLITAKQQKQAQGQSQTQGPAAEQPHEGGRPKH